MTNSPIDRWPNFRGRSQVVGRYGALQNDALARVNGVASEATCEKSDGVDPWGFPWIPNS